MNGFILPVRLHGSGVASTLDGVGRGNVVEGNMVDGEGAVVEEATNAMFARNATRLECASSFHSA